MEGVNTLKNIIANYLSKLWGFLSIFIFVPLYVQYLGVEAYAVISFYTVILGVVSFADAGLSSAITREFAKANEPSYKYSILSIIEGIFFWVCFGIVIVLIFLAPVIANKWLHTNTISVDNLTYYLRLIAVGVAIQLFSSLYFGGLMGMNLQVKANTIQVLWGIARTMGTVVLFIGYKASLEVFFIWQIVCNTMLIVILRVSLLDKLKELSSTLKKVTGKLPSDVRAYIGGMIVISVISAINVQADKIATSSLFTLKQFGYYSLASTLAQVPILISSPLAVTIFPTFSRLYSEMKLDVLYKSFTNFSLILNILVIPVVIILGLYTQEIIELWMGVKAFNQGTFVQIIFITRVLLLGGMFLALQILPFYFLLAQGKTKFTIRQGVVQVIFGLPALYFFILKFGLLGAGISWIIINLGSFVYLYYVLFQDLDRSVLKFFKEAFFPPLILSVGAAAFVVYLFELFPKPTFLIKPFVIGTISILMNVAYYNYKRGNSFLDLKNLLKIQ